MLSYIISKIIGTIAEKTIKFIAGEAIEGLSGRTSFQFQILFGHQTLIKLTLRANLSYEVEVKVDQKEFNFKSDIIELYKYICDPLGALTKFLVKKLLKHCVRNAISLCKQKIFSNGTGKRICKSVSVQITEKLFIEMRVGKHQIEMGDDLQIILDGKPISEWATHKLKPGVKLLKKSLITASAYIFG